MEAELTASEAESILDWLGVEWSKQSANFRVGFIYINGIRSLPVHLATHSSVMPGTTPARFRRLLLVTEEEFRRLRDYELSRDEWVCLVAPRLSSAAD